MSLLSRRRFLAISAACAVLPSASSARPVAQWHGVAMGAKASLRIEGLNNQDAAPVFNAIESELNRLENIFSLYRPTSELCRLNKSGQLANPSPDLLEVLSLCTVLHEASDGVFDPTVQPLWMALATTAPQSATEAARQAIGWGKVSIDAAQIRLPNAEVSALTLNGVAQGAVTDRVAALLKSFGLQNVLVNMGEISARGMRGDGNPWQVGLAGPEGAVLGRVGLSDRALATSAPGMMQLAQGHGHILNPVCHDVHHSLISVSASSAAIADGLSTALCGIPQAKIPHVLSSFQDARLELQLPADNL